MTADALVTSRTGAAPVLEVTDLRVGFGEHEPVRGVTFELRRGERVGLVGESGSGKSLTALSIMRLAHRARLSGQVRLDGTDLLGLSARQMTKVRGKRVAMVYQDPMSSLNPVRTIGHQLVEAIRLHDQVGASAARGRALELLADVGVPQPAQRADQYPHQLSGGMRQRVMIAMAMSAGPDVLLADEPTTALDVTTQARIIDILDRVADEHGTAVLLITHDLGVAAGFCESINVMREGRIVERAPAEQLYRAPQHPYSKALLGAVVDLAIDVTRPIPTATGVDESHGAEPGGDDPASVSPVSVSPVSTPPTSSPASPAFGGTTSADAGGEPLVRVDGLTKTYRLDRSTTLRAVDDVSFDIRRGETFGLVGESGSGKTTVSRAVLALTSVDSGSVQFDGQDLRTLSPRSLRSLRGRMQVVFQDPFAALNRRKTVAQVVEAPLLAHRVGDRRGRADRVDEMLDLVGLEPALRDRLPRTLSGGQCQRVAIARALVLDPDLVVLDEAVSALDVSVQARVLNLLRELQARLGLTYLFISHDLAVIRYMAQRVAVMQQGVIVEQGTREELFAAPRHGYTRSLMAAVPVADPVVERRRRQEARAAAVPR